MNKTFIYKTLYIVFSVNFAFSQIGYIKGIVVSENSDTLYGANIFIEGTQIGTSSDSDGSFIFRDLKPGRYVLNVNYIGYKSKTKELYISSDKSDTNENKNLLLEKIGIEDGNEKLESLEAPFYDNIIFMLPKDPLGLEEIVVAASKVKQKVTNAPGVVSIINANSIRRNIGVDDYTKLASFLKGVDVNYYGIQGASINARGFDGTANTRFRQYEDGVYLGELVTSLVFSPLASPPKESISKIEVLFGPQSALYGPDATQGLLNVIKKHPRYDKKNEMNISLHSSDKYRVGGRFTKSFDKLSYDIVFEASYAGELEYNNCTENCETLDDNQHSPIFYATDENNDGDYNDIGIDGTPESDTLKADFYSDMDQRKASLRTNLYYLLNNDAEVSLATKHQFGQGYAMGSAGPIYLTNSITNTVTLKYASSRNTFRYTAMNQDSDVLQRDILARFQAVNPNLTWKEAKEQFANEDKYWVTVYDGFDQYIDYQFNSNISSSLNLVTGLDFELKDPFTNRTGIKENGYDNFLREEVTTDTDVTEYRYGIYAQLQSNIFDSYELTGSLRYDNHEYYGDMISPKFALVNDSFLNGSLKIIAGRGFKAPTLVDRNIYNGIVDAFAGTAPWNWTIQGKAIGNKDGFTIYDFYDVGNGLRDENEPFIDSNYGFVGSGNTYETQNECVSSGGTYDSQYNSCGNGSYDLGELYWELDGNGFYGPEDILIDSSYVRPLEIEKFTSFEVAYLGALSKSTLIDLNTYFGVYENFKSPLRPQGISGPFFFNDGEAFGSIKQINQGNEILGGHPITDTNEYIYLLTYESMPIKINYYGLELGIKHYSKKYEIAANFSYFNDSDLVNKRDKAEKYYMYLEDPDANSQWSIFSEYQNFYKVYSNTSNLKYNASITLIEPIINNFDISLNLKGVKPFDFVSGYFQATEKYKGQLYNPVEGFKVDEGRVGGGIYMDLNLVYRLDHVSFGASIKNILETKTISFPMTPYLPRSFVVQLGYEF